ncbi:MAG: hypothetical protein PUC70_04610, partial [bacterium]|nr:hypothetical protein [bacterium]
MKEKIDLTVKNYKKKRNEAKINKEIYKEREKYHKSVLEAEKRRDFSETNPHEDSFISLININKIYDNHVQAVYDFNLDIKEKEFIVLVGPSGCGKST